MQLFENRMGKFVLLEMVHAIQNNAEYLESIDKISGDGDHGRNMNQSFTIFGEEIKKKEISFTDGLYELGAILLNETIGASNLLYGTIFMDMADTGEVYSEISLHEFKEMLQAGLSGLYAVTPARVGDKTLFDTLFNAVAALQRADEEQIGFEDALNLMVAAAENGRDSTIQMDAKYGKGYQKREITRGTLDAGAVSCCILLTAIAKGIKKVLCHRSKIIVSDQTKSLKALYKKTVQKQVEFNIDKKEYMIDVSDNIRLRTVCWFPKNKSNLSVVVTRTCYPQQENELDIHAMEYAKRGYGFVVQWCRGINGSQGEWSPNIYERQDGLVLMNWLSENPFIKNIGYWGNSYLASAGWCMADAVPSKVKSMYLGVYGTDRYTSVYKDGLLRQDIFTAWAMDNAGVPVKADYMDSCRFRPQSEVDEKMWNIHLDWYRDWITNTDRDSVYWSKEGFWKMISQIPEKIQIPIFIREGWYDHHLGSAMISWNSLSKQSKKYSKLQIGPWRHNYDIKMDHQRLKNALNDDSVQSPLNWFEETLKNDKLPKQESQLYIIGADRWISTTKDMADGEQKKTLYFSGNTRINGAYNLSEQLEKAASLNYLYNPKNPVFSHGTESCFKTVMEIGSLYQPKCGYRDDVISFVSDIFEKTVTIMGNIDVKLFVSSNAEDTSFTAKIMEVFEDESAVNIRGTITTLAYRNDSAFRKDYIPGNIEEIHLTMWPVAWQIQQNSRLRVDISSSDFPQYALHSNYAGIWSVQKKTKIARQVIYTGKEYDSNVTLPIIDIEEG